MTHTVVNPALTTESPVTPSTKGAHLPKVSVLFITYKHSQFVASAIRSAMAMNYPAFELVVCDDGSPDDTRLILERELENCPPHITVVRSHSPENVGLINNFNRGIAACTGELVIPMSGDDISLPNRISRLVEIFSSYPKCMLVVSDCLIIDANDEIIKGSYTHHVGIFRYDDYIGGPYAAYGGAPVCGASAAYRILLRDKFGPMISGPHGEDNCYWVRALLLGDIHSTERPLIKWRTHSDNLSNHERLIDSPEARRKHIRFLRMQERLFPQWKIDIHHALNNSLTSEVTAQKLIHAISEQRERGRLFRFSLMGAPSKLWRSSCIRLVRASPTKAVYKVVKHNYRLLRSEKRKNHYWKNYFHSTPDA